MERAWYEESQRRLRVSETERKSTVGWVKFKTVTEIRRNSARDTFTAESVYLVLNSLLDWEPVEKWKQRSDVVSFTLLLVTGEQHRIFF